MRQRAHLVAGTLVALTAAPWLRWRVIPLFVGAVLTDADLYAYYVVRHRDLSLRHAARYYNTLTGRRERAVKVLHQPLMPLLAVGARRRHPVAAALAAGVSVHVLLDVYVKLRYNRLRRALYRHNAGICDECGQRSYPSRFLEPYYVGARDAMRDFDPTQWHLICRPCNEAHHRARGTL